MAEDPEPDRLAAFEERLARARKAREPAPRGGSKYTAASLAWRMVLELVVGMALGAGIGYGLDSLAGTSPFLLMLFSILGFAAGVRTMMRTAREVTTKRGEGARLGGAADSDGPRDGRRE